MASYPRLNTSCTAYFVAALQQSSTFSSRKALRVLCGPRIRRTSLGRLRNERDRYHKRVGRGVDGTSADAARIGNRALVAVRSQLAVLGAVTANIMGWVKDMGANGLVGLITLGI